MTRTPVLIDVDGVLADFVGRCLSFINKRTGSNLISQDVKGDVMPYGGDDLQEFVRSPGFCRTLKVCRYGQEAIETLRRMDEKVMFVTSPYNNSPTWCYDRTKWLEDHFGATRDDIVFCRDKRYISGKLLVDDLARNVHDWEQWNQKKGYLWNTYQNEDTNDNYPDYSFQRVFNWEKIIGDLKDE